MLVPRSLRVLTLELTPGTRALPHSLHMKCLRSRPSLTPDLIAILRAISTYLFDSASSDRAFSRASLRSKSIRSSAIFRMFPSLWLVKAPSVLAYPNAGENGELLPGIYDLCVSSHLERAQSGLP